MIVVVADVVSLVMNVSTQRYSPAWARVMFGMNRTLPCAGAGLPLGSHHCTPPPLRISWRALLLIQNTRASPPSGTVSRAGLTTGGSRAMGRESHGVQCVLVLCLTSGK